MYETRRKTKEDEIVAVRQAGRLVPAALVRGKCAAIRQISGGEIGFGDFARSTARNSYTGWKRFPIFLFGNDAEKILAKASCPILVVH